MRKAQFLPCPSFNDFERAVIILHADIPRENRSSGTLRRAEGTMGQVRLRDADLPSLARHGYKWAKLLLILLVVDLSHVVDVPVADLVFVVIIPHPDNFVFVKALYNNGAVCFFLIIEG